MNEEKIEEKKTEEKEIPKKEELKTEIKKTKVAKTKDVGIKVKPPTEKCSDKRCPFHGKIKLRGRIFTGKVIREPFHKTTTVEFLRLFYLPKYERYEKRKSRIKAHIPPCINIKKNNTVKIMESRPISKTKNFIIVEVLK